MTTTSNFSQVPIDKHPGECRPDDSSICNETAVVLTDRLPNIPQIAFCIREVRAKSIDCVMIADRGRPMHRFQRCGQRVDDGLCALPALVQLRVEVLNHIVRHDVLAIRIAQVRTDVCTNAKHISDLEPILV